MIILSVESVARDALRSLMLSLCNIIYKLISFVYEVFYNLGTARILFDSDVQPIFRKIGLIIGLFMVFRVAFAFIQYVVNPDTMFDKQKGIGKIIVKVIVSIVLLGSTQYLFNAAFTIQDKILESQILEKVILGGEYTETENGMRDFGSNLSSTFFTSFYRINDDPNLANSETYNLCKNILGENNEELKENIRTSSGSITGTGANVCLNLKSEYNNVDSNIDEAISKGKIDKEEYIISFDGDGLVALLVGGLCLYTGFMFTFQVAVRLIQLAYLELIAPIPIIMYITPKGDEQLKKWGTQCTTTFLDFFLRVAIIYFAKFIVEIILNSNALNIYADSNAFKSLYLTCIMIIATLIFIKKVPNLLKEIFPSLSGAAGFSYDLSGKAFKDTMKMAYNATPIGWGLHAAKWTAQGIDRKVHGKKFFGPGRLRKKIDEILPEQAAARKEREEAVAARRTFEKQEKKGEELFNRRPDHKIDETFFKSQEFRKSWRTLKDAKDAEDLANEELKAENARYQAAFNSGDQREIAIAKSRVATAEKNLKVASGAVEKAQEFHDKNRAIYIKDREIEDRYTRYKKTHGTPEVYKTDAEILSEAGIGNITNTGTNTDTNTENGQNTNNRIIVEEHVPSQPRQETTSQETVQNEYSRLVNQYNNETDPSKKAAIRKQIDDFERKH